MALAYQRRYGLGDAQIDAQNRATADIGVILEQYANVKNSNQLTPAYVASAKAQIQTVVDNYRAGWSNTERGRAGGATLQNFISGQVFPGMERDLNMLTVPTAALSPAAPSGDLNATPQLAPYDPNIDYTINVGSGSASATPANIQISNTPAPPPGTASEPQNVSAPAWLKNPIVWIIGGLGLMALIRKGGNT